MENNLYQHFRPEEQGFIDTALDWVMQVDVQFAPYLTPFLNPREQFILESVVGQYEQVKLHFYGGFEESERKRAYLAPEYFTPKLSDFEISLVEINYPTKFAELSHGQILGSIIGAGIKREVLGDIVTDGLNWQFLVDQQIASYLFTQLDKIGKIAITLHEVDIHEIVQMDVHWEETTEIVSSMRIDVVLSGALHISRSRVKELIQSGKVKLNWTTCERPDITCETQDILSVRGFGRVQIREIQGKTKKDKLILEMGILDRKN